MIRELELLIAHEKGITIVEVISAVALSDAEKENIISYFNKKLNKTIDIIETINKELVGGLIIKYEM